MKLRESDAGLKEAHEQQISDPRERYVIFGMTKWMMENYFFNPLSEEAKNAYRKEYDRLAAEYEKEIADASNN